MKNLIVAFGLATAPFIASAQALNPPHLREMPSVQRVMSGITAPDPQEAAARQMGAFFQLKRIIEELSNGRWARNSFTPDERRILQAYRSAQISIQRANGVPDTRLMPALRGYDVSPDFRADLLELFFSPTFQAQYARATSDMRTRTDAGGPEQQRVPDPNEPTAPPDEQKPGGVLAALSSLGVKLLQIGGVVALLGVFAAGVAAWVLYKIRNMRHFVVRRNNREAMEAFGADQAKREEAILDAFESSDYTLRYEGTTRDEGRMGFLKIGVVALVPVLLLMRQVFLATSLVLVLLYMRGKGRGQAMRFVLLRNIRSFNRGDLESVRFAYLAFNRGLIDDEKFHWFRFSAIYGSRRTDPAEWEFSGLFKFLKSTRGDIEKARTTLATYAETNAGTDLESQALAAVQALAMQHPKESLFADMRRRFVEGSYWLTKGELKHSVFAPADASYSVSFGVLEGTDTELLYAGEGSIVTIARPGSGKTQCNVFGNLLRWPGPAVVLDVKGEIYDKTSAWRAANVGPVIKFSPFDPLRSACYNPLTGVRSESLYLWEDARFVADMLIVPKAHDPIWEDKAREVLTAIIADVAFWNPPHDRAMAKVLRLVNRDGWADFLDRMRKNPEVETMRLEGTNLANMHPPTLDGALQQAKASLAAFAGERIAQVTRRSDWRPMDLRNGSNQTLYVCVKPNEIKSSLALLRVVMAQHIRDMCTELPPHGAAPILFVLDEMPQLKYMPPVEEALELGRQYGVRVWMFAQSIGQIKNEYPNADGMMASCTVRTFMNPSLQDGTAQMIAEQIGRRTGEEHGGKDTTAKGDALVVQPTHLAGAEFKEMQIVLGVSSKPAKVRKVYAYQDPAVVAKMGALPETPREVRGAVALT